MAERRTSLPDKETADKAATRLRNLARDLRLAAPYYDVQIRMWESGNAAGDRYIISGVYVHERSEPLPPSAFELKWHEH